MVRRLEGVGAVEVYVGDRGHVVIKQEDNLGDEDSIVALLPEQIPFLIRHLQDVAEEAKSFVSDHKIPDV